MKTKVSIVIPTIEEETVFGMIYELKELFKDYPLEIIIVDKSSDAYYRRLVKTGAKVIRQSDKGVENAIMLGLKAASGSILASTDADGTHDSMGLLAGVKLIEQDKADLVLGNRFAKIENGAMAFYIKFGNSALSSIYNIVYKTNIHDVLTGLFVMKRSAFDEIKHIAPYRAGIGFFAIEVAKARKRIAEVPITYYKRRYGESKLTKSKFFYGINVAIHIIRLARDFNPLILFGSFGLFLILIGGGIGITVISSFLSTGKFTLIGRSLIAFMLVVLGMLSIIAGFILDLLIEIEKRISNR